MCPAQDNVIVLTLLIINIIFCPLSDPDVGPSVLVCDVGRIYFHFTLRSVRPQVCSVLVW